MDEQELLRLCDAAGITTMAKDGKQYWVSKSEPQTILDIPQVLGATVKYHVTVNNQQLFKLKKQNEELQKLLQQQQLLQQQPSISVPEFSPVENKVGSHFKIKQPEPYDGSRNLGKIIGFCWDMQTYFTLNKVPTNEQAMHLGFYLTNEAKLWFQQLTQQPNFHTFTGDNILQLLKDYFAPKDTEDKLRTQLGSWKQLTSLDKYIAGFQKLVLQMPFLTENEKIYAFKHNLKPALYRHVNEAKPTTLLETINAANIAEDTERQASQQATNFGNSKNGKRNDKPRPTFNNNSNQTPYQQKPQQPANDPMDVGVLQSRTGGKQQPKIGDEEKKKLMKEGRCFKCKESGHLAKNCPSFGKV